MNAPRHTAAHGGLFLQRTWISLAVFTALFFCARPLAAQVVYVDGSVAIPGPGDSWNTAYRNIYDGIAAADAAGISKVYVARGVYYENDSNRDYGIQILENIAVYGGFTKTESHHRERNLLDPNNVSVINATDFSGTYPPENHAVFISGITSGTLNGFTITAAVNDNGLNGGAGVYCENVSSPNVVIANCAIINNSVTNGRPGGGIQLTQASPIIVNCTISDNTTNNDGGGGVAIVNGSDPQISNCRILGNIAFINFAPGGGGGVYIEDSAPIFENTIIAKNNVSDGDVGGGVFLDAGSSGTFVNCIISGNSVSSKGSSGAGAGIMVRASSPRLINCVIDENWSPDFFGGLSSGSSGVACDQGAAPEFYNTIISNNRLHGIYVIDVASAPLIRNCLFYNNLDGGLLDSDYFNIGSPPPVTLNGAAIVDPAVSGAQGNFAGAPLWIRDSPSAITGSWTAPVAFDGNSLRSTLTDGGQSFTPGELRGMPFNPDTSGSEMFVIEDNGVSTITVVGDVSPYTGVSSPYLILDYRSTALSPMLDAGDDAAPGLPPFDFDGRPRRLDGSDPTNAIGVVDIGPFEYFPAAGPPSVIGVTRLDATPTNAVSVRFNVSFDQAVAGVDVADFQLQVTAGAIIGASVVSVTPDTADATSLTVTINTGTGDGQLRLDVFDDNTIVNPIDNPLGGPTVGDGNFSTGQEYVIDKTAPAVTLTSLAANPTNVSPITVTVNFTEGVTGFTLGDITPGNATAGNLLTVSPSQYTFDLTPTGQGAVTADLGVGAATDLAGNPSTAAAQFSRTFDTVNPGVTLGSLADDPTTVSPITVTVDFTEDVTGFTLGDITPGNATAGNLLTVSPSQYTFDLTPTGQGAVTADLAAGVANDTAGNPNTAAAPFSRTFDTVNPGVTLSTTASDPTSSTALPFLVTFSEPALGFDATDVQVTNGSVVNFAASNGDFVFDVIPAAQGLMTVIIPAGVATDAAGNANTASAPVARLFDSNGPTATLNSTAPGSTNLATIPVTVTFGEPVFGLIAADLIPTSATVANFAGADGSASYSFDLAPTTQGPVRVELPAGVAIDAAGNPNAAATPLLRNFDSVPPTVTLASTAPDPTNVSPIPVTVTFDGPVFGFVVAEVVTSGAVVGNFAGADGSASYSFDLTPVGNGTITAAVPAGVATDAAGNPNLAATPLSRVFDAIRPTVWITSPSSPTTSVSPIPVDVTFSVSVLNFDATALVVTNATVGNFAGGGASYTFELTPLGEGPITVDVPANAATDAAGNPNLPATLFSIVYDATAPTVTLSSTSLDPTNVSPIPVTVTFSEGVTGFDASDLLLETGDTISTFTSVSPSTYTFFLVPDITFLNEREVTADIAADAARDAAGNPSAVAEQFRIFYDASGPGGAIRPTSVGGATNISPIEMLLTFFEGSGRIPGFNPTVITVTNATLDLASFYMIDELNYTFNLIPTTQDGDITATIAAGMVQDAAGNPNTTDITALSIRYDIVNPVGAFTSEILDPTNAAPIPVTLSFNENVFGFGAPSLAAGNATITNFVAADAANYTFDLIPVGQGMVTVDLLAGVATDAAGNSNAAAQFTRTFDSISPSVSLTTSAPNPSTASPIQVTASFSENVTGFDASGISIVTSGALSASIANLSGAGAAYTFDVTLSGEGDLSVAINLAAATDAAGNANTASLPVNVRFDNLPPQVTAIVVGETPLLNRTVEFVAFFSEAVTGVDVSDFALTTDPGIAGAFVDSVAPVGVANAYLVKVNVGFGEGSIRLDLRDDDSIQDAVGNPLGGPGAGNGDFLGEAFFVDCDVLYGCYVDRLYRDILGRAAEPDGRQFYVDHLCAGTMSPEQAAVNFINSPEFSDTYGFVARCYFGLFNNNQTSDFTDPNYRLPDYDGLRFWHAEMKRLEGLSAPLYLAQLHVVLGFFYSPEWQDRVGALDDAALVDFLYRNILGREPEPGGRAYHLARLQSGAALPETLVLEFLRSPEAEQKFRGHSLTLMAYLGLLDREAEPAGFGYYLSRRQALGISDAELLSGFVYSPEYYQRLLGLGCNFRP